MNVAAAVVTGFLALRFLRLTAAPTFSVLVVQRPNHRGRYLPTGMGVLVAMAVAGTAALVVLVGAAGVGPRPGPGAVLVGLAALGFAGLGLADDLVGDSRTTGLAGHLRALSRGHLTTGGIKAAGGTALAVLLAAGAGDRTLGGLVRDALLIALAANAGNVFDRAPGRCIKVSLLAWVPLAAVAGTSEPGTLVAIGAGAALGLLGEDLREQVMLGDAGANALGGVLGTGAVLALSPRARALALVAAAAVNLAAEFVSFSRVIERTPPLRYVDHLGRRP